MQGRPLARRRFLEYGLALAGVGLLVGCHVPRLPWQVERVPRIGYLAAGSREGVRAAMVDGLLAGLGERGYEEGRNLLIEYRFSEGQNDRLPVLAAELVDLEVALIVASGTPAAQAAKGATAHIPIVAGALAADPVGTGFVQSLARPGSNFTGTAYMTAQLGAKRLQLLKETLPRLARVAILSNPPNPTYGPVLREFDAAAPALDLELMRLEVRGPEDFEGAFAAALRQGAGALFAPADPLTTNQPRLLADLMLKYRLPMMMEPREFADAGGLLTYGPNIVALYRHTAAHVDKILKGANPAELPIEQPTTFDFIVSLKAAHALGLTIPSSVLQQATEVIE